MEAGVWVGVGDALTCCMPGMVAAVAERWRNMVPASLSSSGKSADLMSDFSFLQEPDSEIAL